MGFLKSLFTGKVETQQEQQENDAQRKFDILKFDGVKALKYHDMVQAERCLVAALEIKDDLEVRDYLSQVFIQSAQFDEAMKELEVLLRAEPTNQDLLMRMVQVAFLKEDYEQMAQLCQQAIDMEGSSPTFKYMFARAKQGLGLNAEALEWLDKTIAENERIMDAHLLRGDLLLEMNRNDEAEEETKWLLERFPDNEDVLMLVVHVQQAQGQLAEAIATCGQVVDLNPFNIQAYQARAALREKTGDAAGAAEDLRLAAEMAPEGTSEDIEQQVNQAYRNTNPFGM